MSVLGGMAVECDGIELAVPPSGRPWSLLAYLALHPGRLARSELAARFWPDVLDSSARASLRSAVWSAAGEHERALEFVARGEAAIAGHGPTLKPPEKQGADHAVIP